MEDNLKFLNEELEKLKKKIAKERENDNIGTYKNLIQAFRNVLDLVNEEENKVKADNVRNIIDIVLYRGI